VIAGDDRLDVTAVVSKRSANEAQDFSFIPVALRRARQDAAANPSALTNVRR